jgi:hypothetical protein
LRLPAQVPQEQNNDKYSCSSWSSIPYCIGTSSIKNSLKIFESECNKITNRIKKSLFHNRSYWKEIDTYDSIFSIIENGYSLDFVSYPPSMQFGNNKSAMANAQFVSEEVLELADSGRIVQVK